MTLRARVRLASFVMIATSVARTTAHAQPSSARRWLVRGVLLAASVAVDTRMQDVALRNRTAAGDRAANLLEPLGRAGVLVPGLAAAVILPRLAGDRAFSDAALRVSAGYAAADAIESVLKPAIGRHRPSDGGGPWRLRPFQNDADWHSLPSAHTVHDFAIAAGIAGESDSRIATGAAYGLAALVG